jgi:hypothetical protein
MGRGSAIAAALFLSLGVACGKRSAPAPVPVPVGAASVATVASAPPLAPSATPLVDASVPFVPLGCERPFPSSGTRYAEVREDAVTLPESRRDQRGKLESFGFGAFLEPSRSEDHVRIDEAANGSVVRAERTRFHERSVSGPIHARIVADGDGGLLAHATPPSEYVLSAAADDQINFGAARLPRALVRRDTRGIGQELAALLEYEYGSSPTRVSVLAPTRRGDKDVYRATVTLKRGSGGRHVALVGDAKLEGELVVRAEDAAFVELTLAGPIVMNYVEGPGAPYGPVVGTMTLHRVRECFRVALTGER